MILDIECKNKRVTLGTLVAGDVFIFDGNVCMKTNDANVNAIGLRHGATLHLCDCTEVEFIEDARLCGTSFARDCELTSNL